MKIIISFDFSINKPASTIIIKNDEIFKHRFFIWPLNLNRKTISRWNAIDDVQLFDRQLPALNSKDHTSSEMTYIHTERSSRLSNKILHDIDAYLSSQAGSEWNSVSNDIYITSEGLSFSSHGNETMNLATYKGVLLSDLYRQVKTEKIYTFSPLTIKSVAGCAGKKDRGDKNSMINAFARQRDFKSKMRESLPFLKEKKNYIHCVDDIVDSYWAARTMYKKLNLDFISQWMTIN